MHVILSAVINVYIINASFLWSLYIDHKALVITGLLLLFLLTAICIRVRIKKKRKKEKLKKPIPPVSDILGNKQELIDALNRDLKPFGFAYDHIQDIFYSLMDCWQRSFGYFRLYDEACAAFSMIIDCEPIYFNYNGKRWMIEFWKGQYGMTTGGEVGIYYTSGPDLNIPGLFNGTFYFCVKDEDRINMSFIFKKNGKILFTRSDYHWWITGFRLGEFSYPSELEMDIVLDLNDKQMVDAFVNGLREAGYTESEYAVRGRRVYVHFDKPHTKQPITRNPVSIYMMQRNNQTWCDAYNSLTQAYGNTAEKLAMIKVEYPSLYNRILNMGKPYSVFEIFHEIKGFLNLSKTDTGE